jgi:ABC-type transport system involved in cytochrome c biogenesis permease component
MKEAFMETLLLARKDFLSLYRAPGGLTSCLIFSLMLAVVSSFAVRYAGMQRMELISVGGGLVWLVFLFSALVFINQLTLIEREQGAVNALLLSRISRESIFLSKYLVCFVSLALTS